MERNEFLRRANHRLSAEAEGFSLTPIDDASAAADVVDAVLDALDDRLGADQSALLADRIPEGLDEHPSATDAEAFDYEAFLDRVADRSAVERDREEVGYHAKAVVALLYDADVAGDDRGLDLQAVLPSDYDPLFEFVDGARPWDKYEDFVLDDDRLGEE